MFSLQNRIVIEYVFMTRISRSLSRQEQTLVRLLELVDEIDVAGMIYDDVQFMEKIILLGVVM